jgi:outer membrane protein assembly factor BamE
MKTRQFSIAVFAALAAGCQSMHMPSLPVIGAYHIDIQQGNLVTQDMVAKLQPGMTRSQVRFVLGTPLVADVFHQDRWDYIYRYEKGGKLVENRRIVAVFKDDKLVRIEGDVVPAAAGKPAATSAPASPAATSAPGTPPTAAPAAPSEASAPTAGSKPDPAASSNAPAAVTGSAPEAKPAPAAPADAAAVPDKK